MDNMTAKVSCFARAYHYKNYDKHIFADDKAAVLLGDDYDKIAESMSQGISFFLPDFHGSREDGLRLIVDRQLSPSVLARNAFCENMLCKAMGEGCVQYLIFAAGYDTFGIRNTDHSLSVFELDLPEMLEDKTARQKKAGLNGNSVFVPCDLSGDTWKDALRKSGFTSGRKTFGSLLGISYYLEKEDFRKLLMAIVDILSVGSEICMDYPTDDESKETKVNQELASAAQEWMKAKYSSNEMKVLLENCGFRIVEQIDPAEMTEKFFTDYNKSNPDHRMKAPAGVCYCMARKAGFSRESIG